MSLETPLLFLLDILVAFLAIVLAIGGWRRPASPGREFFVLLMLVLAFWLIVSGLGGQARSVEEKILWNSIALIGLCWASPTWLALAITFLDVEWGKSNWLSSIFWSLPVISTILVITNEYHGLVWSQVMPIEPEIVLPVDLGLQLRYTWGIWFGFYSVYAYLLSLIGFFMLFSSAKRYPAYQKKQGRFLAIGWLFPWIANLVFFFGWPSYPGFDPTPAALLFTCAYYFWNLIKLNLFDPARLAQLAVLANIGDGYLVFDTLDRVVDANQKARRFLGLEGSIIGQSAQKLFAQRQDVINLLRFRSFSQMDLAAGEETPLFLEALLVPWFENERERNGRILILHDVTRRKTLEISLHNNLAQHTFTNDLLQFLYRPNDLTEALYRVIERIARYAHAERVSLWQDNPVRSQVSIVLSWSTIDDPSTEPPGTILPFDILPGWQSEMETNGMVIGHQLPGISPDMEIFLKSRGALSMAAFPIFGNQGMFGFLLLESMKQQTVWDAEILDQLRGAARIISGAVARWSAEEAEHRQRDLAEALRDMASALNSTLNLEEVLDRALANLIRVVPHDAASFALLEEEEMLRFVRWHGYDADSEAMIPRDLVPLSNSIPFQEMATTHQPVIVPDVQLAASWVNWGGTSWIRSYLGVPVQVRGRLVGFINLDSRQPGFFNTEHADRLRAFADDLAVAFENARLYDEARRRAEEMSILYRIGMTLTAGLVMDQLLAALLEECRKVLPIDVFYVALFEAEQRIVQYPMFWEQGTYRQIEPRRIDDQPGLSGEIIHTRQTMYLPDTLKPAESELHQLIRSGGVPSRSYVGVPLIVRDQVVGVLSIQSYQPNAYSIEQIRLLETIATQAAVAVENARVFDQMKQMAITDPVTQLFTRRHFTNLGHTEVDRSIRYGRSLSVLMVDIDRFKLVNDRWGHNAGDVVLLHVAQLCKQVLRQSDMLGRWGGEEFAIVLPEANIEVALTIAERIRRMIETTDIPISQRTVRVTVSIGVASLSQTCSNLEGLLNCADQAMYSAKSEGRNLVRIYGE